MTRPSVYVGCSLTHAPTSFKAEVEALKAELRADYEVFDFLGLTAGTPADVYRHDIEQSVAGCDLFVAICDQPSTGLGYEIAAAVERFHKPVLALAHTGAHVTRMVEGIPASHYAFKRYNHLSEVSGLIKAQFALLHNQA